MGYLLMTTKKVEINCSTNEVIEREMTTVEIANEKAFQDELAAIENQRQAEIAEREAKRNEILDRLGLTEHEAKLLLS